MNFCLRLLLLIADQVIAVCFITPLVICYWRGAYKLMGIYILPDNPTLSACILFGVGYIGLMFTGLIKYLFERMVSDKLCSVRGVVGFNLYLYVSAFIYLSSWRSTWLLLDHFTTKSLTSQASTLAIGLVCLCLLKSFKNCWIPPVICCVDSSLCVFEYHTRFKTDASSPVKHVLDVFLSYVIVFNLVVCFWRGTWGLLDMFLYPDDQIKSITMSLMVAGAMMLVMIPIQIVLGICKLREDSPQKIIVEDLVLLIANVGSIFYWRAVWTICDVYLLPDKGEVGLWVCYAIGVVGTGAMMCSSSYVGKNFALDGSTYDEETGALFPNSYTRYFVNKRQSSTDDSENITLLPKD